MCGHLPQKDGEGLATVLARHVKLLFAGHHHFSSILPPLPAPGVANSLSKGKTADGKRCERQLFAKRGNTHRMGETFAAAGRIASQWQRRPMSVWHSKSASLGE
jgi:hypothetical protein